MTLADLAALAAKVERFQRPKQFCPKCGGTGQVERSYLVYGECQCEVFPGWEWDNSPAALAMAAILAFSKTQRPLFGRDHGMLCIRLDSAPDSRETPESIARALLTTLLRAHGVEVPSE